ncbi:tyrosine-type recombinase/integrase [Tissierella sp. Yu-01]|uniref:tyrosine-type recombinase/integrase n=1 Tax=Tissierella sp. Yu-01 TaxID=3035694 RepID=UPI00240E2358|nr:tyrosine-type recombinase/integrase [Tissierella sp. Yu-01]WFA09567.1 tyrosine-type recombinase/integrase [Tissierella sp. Yu-01]
MKRITLKQSLEEFPTYLNIKGMTESTSKAYIGDLKIFKSYMKDNYPSITYIDTIKNFHIISYRNFLVEKIKTKEYKKTTVDRKFDSIKIFFDYLDFYNYIEENFVKDFSFQRFRNITFSESGELVIPRFLEQDEIKLIIDEAKKDRTENKFRDVAILEILRNTGCRRSSIIDLEWKDIDFRKKEILIKHRKSKNWSLIPLNKVLEQALIDYNASLTEHTPNVFNLKKDAFTDMINKYVKKSGLHEEKDFKITAHIFRHSFITFLVKKKMPLEKIAKFTGHKDTRSLEVYTHLVPDDLKDVSDLFN